MIMVLILLLSSSVYSVLSQSSVTVDSLVNITHNSEVNVSNMSHTTTSSTFQPIDCGKIPPPPYSFVSYMCVRPDCTATVHCRPGYVSSGVTVYTCSDEGKWILNGSNITVCTENDATTSSANSSSSAYLCPTPEVADNSIYHINGSIVVYSCSYGYKLLGEATRICLQNQTWSGQMPTCTLDKPPQQIPPSTSQWMKVFSTNSDWEGHYSYFDQPIWCKLRVENVFPNDELIAEFTDGIAKLRLKGTHISNITELQLLNLVHSSERFTPQTYWSVRGILTIVNGDWNFTGVTSSSTNGFEYVTLKPMRKALYKPRPLKPHSELSSAATTALGIIIAILAIIVAGSLAMYYMKRKAFTRSGTAHHTLTSFENPVYEYEK